MPLNFDYTPPKVNAVEALSVAGELAIEGAGKVLLDASQQLVPVETGALKASGQVTKTGPHEIAVSYGRDDHAGLNGTSTSEYAIPQHEHLENNHPNGGQAKYLEAAMHANGPAILAALAEGLRAGLL